MRPHFTSLLLFGLSFAPAHSQQQTPTAEPTSVSVTPELGLHGRTPQVALHESFPDAYDVTVGTGATSEKRKLSSCEDVLALGDTKHSAASTPDNNSLHSAEARCYALDWVRNAKPAARPAAAPFSLRTLHVSQLPPELALAISDDQTANILEAASQGKSILAIEDGLRLRPISANTAKLVAEDWTALLTVYASGDLTGSGKEQVVLRWDASATGGSYTIAKVFLLERRTRGFTVLRQR